MHIAVDAGSTHLGRRDYAKELIREAKNCGADSIKFQLFKKDFSPQNIELNRDLFMELVNYGKETEIPVTASHFDQEALNLLVSLDVLYYKFAYSQSKDLNTIQGLLKSGKRVVVTTDPMHVLTYPDESRLTLLYVDTVGGASVYPVPWMTSFENLFPPFDGFSDHHRGIGQAIDAVKMGATWIEKHFSLQYDDCKKVPDFAVSMSPAELYELARAVK